MGGRDKIMSLYSSLVLNLYTKPRGILSLFRHKELYSAESYYKEAQKKIDVLPTT